MVSGSSDKKVSQAPVVMMRKALGSAKLPHIRLTDALRVMKPPSWCGLCSDWVYMCYKTSLRPMAQVQRARRLWCETAESL